MCQTERQNGATAMNPNIPTEKTPFQKFQALAKGLICVPKSEIDQKVRDERKPTKQIRKNTMKRQSMFIALAGLLCGCAGIPPKTITIESDPLGARVEVNNSYLGQTPTT